MGIAPRVAFLASASDYRTSQVHERLLTLTPTDNLELETAWRAAAERAIEMKPPRSFDTIPEQYLILVTCRDEAHQRELLERFQSDGLDCKPLLS